MKKIISKILSIATATAAIGAVIPNVVEKESYADAIYLGDANGDYKLTYADASTIQQYLSGSIDPTDKKITCMDINEDGVIDESDYIMIVDIVSSFHPQQPNHTFYDDNPDYIVNKSLYTTPNNEGREYYRHDCTDSDLTSKTPYTLPPYPIAAINNEDEQLRTPTDVIDHSNRNVVRITTSGGAGSGFIVDDHIIATAAHVIYNRSDSTFEDDVEVEVYNYSAIVNSSNLLCTTDAVTLHIPKKYATLTGGYQDNYDYALIYVEDDLSDYGIWKIGIATDEFIAAEDGLLTTSGFRTKNGVTARYCSTGSPIDYVQSYSPNNLKQYRMKTEGISYPGKSGGAVYYSSEYGNYTPKSITGIVTGSANGNSEGPTWAVRFTPTLITFYLRNTANLLEPS